MIKKEGTTSNLVDEVVAQMITALATIIIMIVALRFMAMGIFSYSVSSVFSREHMRMC